MTMNNLSTMYNRVYYVHSSNPEVTMNLIAIRPIIGDHLIEWGDTSWGTRLQFKRIDIDKDKNDQYPKEIRIITKDGQEITLTLLNLENYNAHVREWVVGQISFNSDEELQQYYLKTNFLAY